MPFVPNTPESHAHILNPPSATICRGISNDGKPCKRELVRSKVGDPSSGVITLVNKQDAYFCSRHAEQAKDVVLRHTASFSRRRALVGRGSLDTLIEQVEVLVGDGQSGRTVTTKVVNTTKKVPRNKDAFRTVQEDDGENDDSFKYKAGRVPKPTSQKIGSSQQQQNEKKHGGFARLLMGCCCILETDEDEEISWSEKRRVAELRSAATAVVDNNFHTAAAKAQRKDGQNAKVAFESVPPTPSLPMMLPKTKGVRASPAALVHTPSSVSEEDNAKLVDLKTLTKEQHKVLALIPKQLPAPATARLQQELIKPFSDRDEPGYIYMFWLTDSPISPFSTPVTTPGGTSPGNSSAARRARTHTAMATDALMRATLAPPTPGGHRPKLLFKIGRANNVQRRLHEWTVQCGYNLQLIRYYPHTSATSSPSSLVARKVPNASRVERLIHLELGATPGANPKKQCAVCGKAHREWFEVDGSREGVLAVDAVIKRWVEYGERYGLSLGADVSPGRVLSARMPMNSTKGVTERNAPNPAVKKPGRPQPHRSGATGKQGASPLKMYEKKARLVNAKVRPVSTNTAASGKSKPQVRKKGDKKKKVGGDENDVDEDSDWGEENYSPS